MPSNWLYIDTNFPTFTGEEETEEKVSTIQNYLFMLVEQLRYSLHNLDLGNMNQAAVDRFTGELTEPIYGRIEDAEGNLTRLGVTAQGLAAKISDAQGNITALQATAQGLASQVKDAQGNISSLQQTASSISATVANQAGQLTSIRQSVDSISLGVFNGDTSSTICLYKDGIAVSSQAIAFSGIVTFSDLSTAGRTAIYGGNILTDSLYLDSLYGHSIYLRNAYGQIGAEFRIGSSYTATDRVELWTRAFFLYADQGDIYLTSNSGYVTLDAAVGVTCHANLFPGRANWYDCGTYGFPWRDVYTQDGFVQSSDGRGKKEIDYDMSRYSGLFDRLRPCSFLRTNGTSGRRHHGFIAQEVRDALEAEGMSGKDFAGYVDWEDGEEYGCGLRYEEMLAMIVYELQEVKRRVDGGSCERMP